MADVRTLIKMQKLYVDEQRRVLAARQAEADAIMMAIVTLQANLESEKARATEQPDAVMMIGAYIRTTLHKHEQLQRSLSAKEREVEKERAKLSVLFEELKRYEIAQENWDAARREELAKRENLAYDEQAGQRHHKQKGET